MGVGAGYTVELKSISPSGNLSYSYEDQTFDEDIIVLRKGTLHVDSGRLGVSKVNHPYWGFSEVEFPCVDIDMPLPDATIYVGDLNDDQVLDLIPLLLKAGATSDYDGNELDDEEKSLEYLKSLLNGFPLDGKLDAKELFEAIDTDIKDEIQEYVYDFSEWNSGVMSGGYIWCRPDGVFTFEGSVSGGVGLLDQNGRDINGIEFKEDSTMISLKSEELAEAIVECHDLYDDDEEDEEGFTYNSWLEDLRNRY